MTSKRIKAASLLAVVCSVTLVAHGPAIAHGPSDEARRMRVATELENSSVLIRSGRSRGTGFVVGERRWIVTNAHVVKSCRCRNVIVQLPSGCRTEGEVVAYQPDRDLAIVATEKRLDLPSLPLGDPHDLRIGQTVLAYGHPFGLVGTLTHGIVSARRTWKGIPGVIQTDASINPGNSGGPLADLSGRVVGVNSSIMPGMRANHGIAFAVPSTHVVDLLDAVRASVTRAADRDFLRCGAAR